MGGNETEGDQPGEQGGAREGQQCAHLGVWGGGGIRLFAGRVGEKKLVTLTYRANHPCRMRGLDNLDDHRSPYVYPALLLSPLSPPTPTPNNSTAIDTSLPPPLYPVNRISEFTSPQPFPLDHVRLRQAVVLCLQLSEDLWI